MLVDSTPSEIMVDWTEVNVENIKHPKDRPWFHADPPPPYDTAFWDFPCRCNGEEPEEDTPLQMVETKRFICEDNKAAVYVGQCQRCETVVWSYRSI